MSDTPYVTQTNALGTRTHLLRDGKLLGTFVCDGHAELVRRIAEMLNRESSVEKRIIQRLGEFTEALESGDDIAKRFVCRKVKASKPSRRELILQMVIANKARFANANMFFDVDLASSVAEYSI